MRHLLTIVALVLSTAAPALAQQEACPLEMNVPKLSLADMFAKSDAKAKAWKADAVVARITNTTMGPLDEAGKSEAWNLMFFSPSANASVNISTFRGMFTCYAMAGPAGRLPALKPGFMRDGAKLYAVAKQQAGTFLAEGYTVSIGTAAAPGDNKATWNINLSKNNKNAPLLILVDANTGLLDKVIKD